MSLKFVGNTVKRLQNRYPSTIAFYRATTNDLDVVTGNRTRTYSATLVKPCLVFPNNTKRDFHYGLSFVAAAKNFTYGGLSDVGDFVCWIRPQQLPFKPLGDDFVTYNRAKYQILSIAEYPGDQAYELMLKGEKSNQEIYLIAGNEIVLGGTGVNS